MSEHKHASRDEHEWLDGLAEPLRLQVKDLQAEVAQIDEERTLLNQRLHRVEQTLARLLDGSTAKAKSSNAGQAEATARQRSAARKATEEVADSLVPFLDVHRDELGEGPQALFGRMKVLKLCQANGVKQMTEYRLQAAMEVLERRGVVRVKGHGAAGGKLYQLS